MKQIAALFILFTSFTLQAATSTDTSTLNYLQGLTNPVPPAPGLQMHLNDTGLPRIDIVDAQSSVTRSNLQHYAKMDHGRPVDLEQVRPSETGAIGDYGPTKAFFPSDISANPVRVISPGGKVLAFRPTFLVVANRSTGDNYLLGAITNSSGAIVGSQVEYASAFDSIDADVRLVYSCVGMEQFIVIHDNPTLPPQWNDEQDLSLECWTEWFDSEPVQVSTNTITLRSASTQYSAVSSLDCAIDFGTLKIGSEGRAFELDRSNDTVSVGKRWVSINDSGAGPNRRFLIETVDYLAAKPKLQKLKKPGHAEYQRFKPSALFAKTSSTPRAANKPLLSAQRPSTKPGFVVDFNLVNCYTNLSSLVSWWEGEDNANDLAGLNNGTFYNGNTYVTSGKLGHAFNFNGVNQHVRVSNANGTLQFSSSMTIECWIWPAALGNWQNIVSKWDGTSLTPPQSSYAMGLYPDGRVYFGFSYGGSSSVSALSTTYLPADQWTHVAGTYDGYYLRIFVNGNCEQTVTTQQIINHGSDDLAIGGCVGGLASPQVQYPFNGLIDEVTIYSSALDQTRVQAIYNAGTQGKCSGTLGGGGGGSGCVTAPANVHNWWPADNTPNDVTGGATLTLNSGVNYVPGKVNQGFNFDGSTGVGTAINSINPQGTYGDFTIEMWVKPNDNNMRPLLEFGDNSTLGLHMWANYPSPGYFYCNLRGGYADHPIQCSGIVTGWYTHLAITYSSTTGNATLYINGSPSAITYYGNIPISFGQCNFGKRVTTWAGTYYFYGVIDEPTFYSRALADSEIAAIASAGSYGKCSPAQLPVIVNQPQSVTVALGASASFTVGATGSAPLAYQWYKNDDQHPVASATSASLVFQTVRSSDVGMYYVRVSNSGGTATSQSASLNIIPAPVITLPGTAPVYKINGPPVPIDSQASVYEPNLSGFAAGWMTVRVTDGVNANDQLEVRDGGPGPGQIGVFVQPGTPVTKLVTYEGVAIGTITGSGAGSTALRIDFNSNASLLAISALVRSVTYRSLLPNPPTATRKVEFQIADGHGGTSNVAYKFMTYTCLGSSLDVILVIDHSSSMGATDPNSLLSKAKAAAESFVQDLIMPADRAGVVQFDGDAQTIQPLTSSKATVLSKIESIPAGGCTAIGKAVSEAHTDLLQSANSRVIVLLTDGTDSTPDLDPEAEAKSARDAGIRLITIRLGETASEQLLMNMASPNPARANKVDYYQAPTADDLKAVYDQIASSICREANAAPVVNAGPDLCATLDNSGVATVSITATASDDGNPAGSILNRVWSVVSAPYAPLAIPNQVTFAPPDSPTPTVSFTVPGVYTLRLTASDGYKAGSDDVQVCVFPAAGNDLNSRPIVDAGLPQWITVGSTATLNGTAKARGCQTQPAILWTQESGPAPVAFSPNTSAATVGSGFAQPGQYVLKLTACSSGSPICGSNPSAACDTVTIYVCNEKAAPADIALVLDDSPTMADFLGQTRMAATYLADLMDFDLNRLALIHFAEQAALWQPLIQDRDQLKRSIAALGIDGVSETRVASAVRMAKNEVLGPHHNPAAMPVIIVQSDGSWADYLEEIQAAFDEAKLAGIRVMIVAIGQIEPDDTRHDMLKLAASSDADCFFMGDSTDMTSVYAKIVQSFCLGQNRRPVVSLGPDRYADMTHPVQLRASVWGQGKLTYQWENITPGTGEATFDLSTGEASPQVTFKVPGSYVLKVTVTDEGNLLRSSATVNIQAGLNSPPVAFADVFAVPSYTSRETTPVSTQLDVLANDVDPDGDVLRITAITIPPEIGVAEIVGGGAYIRYTPPPDYGGASTLLTYEVSDPYGHTATASATIFVMPLNQPLKANNDTFTVGQGSGPTLLNVLANDADPDPVARFDTEPLPIVACTSPAAGSGTAKIVVDSQGLMSIYYTPPSSPCQAKFNYTICDRYGAQSTATVTVNVVASPVNSAPTVSAGTAQTVNSLYPQPTTVLLQGTVTDDGMSDLSLTWSCVSAPGACVIDREQQAATMAHLTGDGVYTFTLKADDNVNPPVSSSVTITVKPTALVARIYNLKDGDFVREGFFKVQGAADDPNLSSSFSYKLEVRPVDAESDAYGAPVASFSNNHPVPASGLASELGTLDLTKLTNGHYQLLLTVSRDLSTSATLPIPFVLDSPLKLGRLTFSQQDVVIPVEGLPLTVLRTYDSFNSSTGAFGFGWTYNLADMNAQINETRADQSFNDLWGEGSLNIRTGGGRDVTLTLPDGRRTTFQFTLRRGMIYAYAEWLAAPDIFARLEPMGDNRLSSLGVLAWQAAGFYTPYENYDFPGFNLIMPDGTSYELDRDIVGDHFFAGDSGIGDGTYIQARGQPTLKRILRPDGETILVKADRIEHYHNAGDSTPTHTVLFKRDNASFPTLITSIMDPNTSGGVDPVMKYEYTGGDLSKVYRLVRQRSAGGPTYEVTTYTYGENGAPAHYLTKITDPRGQVVASSSYDANGRLYQVTSPKGPTTIVYDLTDNGLGVRKQTTTDYLGNRTEQSFDSRGNVVTTKDAYQIDGSAPGSTTRTFDDANNLLTENSPGRFLENTYDSLGNLASQRRDAWHASLFFYNEFSQLTGMADARAQGTDPNALTVVNTYEAVTGKLLTSADAEHTLTTYSYFPAVNRDAGRLDKVTDAVNNTVSYQYDDRGNVSTETTKDSGGNVLSSTTSTYDANNNRLTQSLTRTLPGGALETATTSYVYDPQNRLIETIDPLLHSTKTYYNSLGKICATVDALQHATLYGYDASGDLTVTTNADLSVARRVTIKAENFVPGDQYTRIDVVEDPHAPTESNIKGNRSVYDRMGRVIQADRVQNIRMTLEVSGEVATTTLQSYTPIGGSATLTSYEGAGRVYQVTDCRNLATTHRYDPANTWSSVDRTDDSGNHQTVYSEYDDNGNVKHTYIPYVNGLGQSVSGSEVYYQYDFLNRITNVLRSWIAGLHDTTHSNQESTIYDASGRAIQKIDPAGVKTGFKYDALGRLTAVTNAYGATDQTITQYQYDEAGNLTNQIDAELRITGFASDKMGRRLSRTLPELQSEFFSYDEVGNCHTHRDFKGKTTTYDYNVLNRLQKKTQDPSLGTFCVSYTYTPDGRRDTITDSTGRNTTYTYDERNRLTRKVSPEGVLNYTYDDDGNVLKVQSAKNGGDYQTGYGGISLAYDWDNLNRLKSVTDLGAGNSVTTYTYDLLDRVTECDYPAASGVTHTYSYNDANWLTGVTIKKNSSTVASFAYDFARASGSTYYGRAGTRMKVAETGRIVEYEYDPLYRLTKENVKTGSPNGAVTYDGTPGYTDTGGFDKVGNRRSRNSALSGVPAVGQTTYTANDKLPGDGYDANGNTTTSGGLTYGYDFEDHLTSRNGSPALSYAYDQDGNRVKKVSGSTTTYYLVDEKSPTGYPQVVEELSAVGANPTLLKTYTYGLKLISQRPAGGQVQYYGHDGQASTRLLFDNNGNTTQTYAYDAFGILISPTTPPSGNDYLYAGEQYDRDLGLYYLRARYYNPQTGRFWTKDTYEGNNQDPPSLHKYLYCADNPVNAVDPSGNESMLSVQASISILSFVGSQYLHASSATLNHVRTRYDTQNSFAELSYGVDVMFAVVDSVQTTMAMVGAAQGATYLLTRGAPYLGRVIRAAMRESFPNWTFIHNKYLQWVRPNAVEKTLHTPWGSIRRLDDYDPLTKAGFEAKMTDWENISQEEFQRVMRQIADDYAIVRSGGGTVERMIWFGANPLPQNGLGGRIKQALSESKIEYWHVPLPQ